MDPLEAIVQNIETFSLGSRKNISIVPQRHTHVIKYSVKATQTQIE